MSLTIACDRCGAVYFRWEFGKSDEVPSQIEVWRKHVCNGCAVAMAEAERELAGWKDIESAKLSGEYERRFNEAFERRRKA